MNGATTSTATEMSGDAANQNLASAWSRVRHLPNRPGVVFDQLSGSPGWDKPKRPFALAKAKRRHLPLPGGLRKALKGAPLSDPKVNMPTNPPVAPRKQHSSTYHGITREDPYHWLRAENWQDMFDAPEKLDTEIRTYLEAENAYYEENFGTPHAALKDKIFTEIRGRIKEDDSGIPTPDGRFAYNSRMEEGKQYPVIVRTAREGGAETILLSTEPYRFGEKHKQELERQLKLPVHLIDGEMTSWYGPRAIAGLRYLADFSRSIT